jgi:hypothetical protein
VSASRERIRVYTEDDYFAQGGQRAEVARDGLGWPRESSDFSANLATAEEAHGLRMAAGALLIAGAGALGVVLALGAFASSTHVRRKAALRAARANARTASVASAIVAARTTQLRPKAISGARRVRPTTVTARHTRPTRGRASVRNQSNARSTSAATSRAAAGRALPSTHVAAGEPGFPDARRTAGDPHGQSTEIAAASSNSASRRGSGEFGFER